MKYYKSKRGYFYKVVGDKKIRISIEEYKTKTKKKTMKGGFNKDGVPGLEDFFYDKEKFEESGETIEETIFLEDNNVQERHILLKPLNKSFPLKLIERSFKDSNGEYRNKKLYLFFFVNGTNFKYCYLYDEIETNPLRFYTPDGIKEASKIGNQPLAYLLLELVKKRTPRFPFIKNLFDHLINKLYSREIPNDINNIMNRISKELAKNK